MKIFKTVAFSFIWLFIALVATVHAQKKSGIVTYKGIINQKHVENFIKDLKADKEVSMRIKQKVAELYRNAKPDFFELHFKNDESYYFNLPALEEKYNIGSKAATYPFYTNITTDSIIGMTSSLGNIAKSPINWEITRNTKIIGGYKCYQAKATESLFSRQGFYYDVEVVAWFAPEIPLEFGPQNYSGLPGLILQVERPKFTITATKINLNPKDGEIRIKRPNKNDKIISEQEAHARISELEADRKRKRSR